MTASPKCYGIIPARYQSTRFPGKPLADILGRPMIWHVFERARQCTALSSVVLATDDDRIRSAAQKWGIPVVMTRADHPSGTDRVLEAAERLKLNADAVIVNIQGDEPVLEPAMLTELVNPFGQPDIQVTTLARKISAAEAENPDLVKVVFAADHRALYFSRSPIPFQRSATDSNYYGHIGIYALRMPTLKKFVTLDQSRLEVSEKLEQLRLLENNIPIHIVETAHRSIGVDRQEDIETVIKILLENEKSGSQVADNDLDALLD
jgi:3-deoxy-manno-octulosonate cytidylyltransferase (CMP-KDO synthetase)